ncbi:glycosyltransferase family 32 protein [Loigolactobacillus jiayinensis]|uniref:Glycosyltransferase family 32 protein n=1 Tax=Loigolactobacillus jiayinensis TaxID=2486016 RepID=A0ABW1RCC3_9LACO|nr:glycosyltransferase [Loigolactobacillus jiayinensis]
MAIPKIIHYCWFGHKELSTQTKEYIKSWEKYAPDYKIIRWDESNFDINQSAYCQSAYKNKLYPFVADYARLAIMYKYGGIYLDTDVELLKPIDHFLDADAFFGLENYNAINTGLIFGAIPKQKNVKALLKIYDLFGNNLQEGTFIKKTCVKITTEYFKKLGFREKDKYQIVNNCFIYPTSYFCPQKYGDIKAHIKKNTVTWHHYNGSWTADTKAELMRTYRNARIGRRIKALLGSNMYDNLYLKYKKIIKHEKVVFKNTRRK